MPSFDFPPSASRALGAACLGLLLGGCASGSLWDMSENARNRLAARGDIKAIRFQQSSNYYDSSHTSHERDPAVSLKWIRKGVELNDPSSQITLATMLLYSTRKGPGAVERNPAEAMRLAKAAVETMQRPSPDGEKVQPSALENAKKLAARAEVIATQTPLAEKGDADAMWALSQAYSKFDIYARENPTQAEEDLWRLKAAEAGQPEAATAMAARTFGAEELKWKQIAAARDNNPEAMYSMANSLRDRRDEAGALEWYRKAAAKGHAGAKKQVLQLSDPTVVRLKAAAKNGDAEAMYQLGEYFRAGKWDGKDAAIAQAWYQAAAGKGHVKSAYQAALGSNDKSEKERLMRTAAAAGHAEAAAWVTSEDRWQAAEKQRREQEAEASRRKAEAKAQQQLADQQAFVARIDREGSTDMFTVEQYCKFGGRRCDALRIEVRRAMERGNAAAASANMQRIQDYTSNNDGKTQTQRDQEYRDRLACTQRNTQAIQNNTYGKTDWAYKDCN